MKIALFTDSFLPGIGGTENVVMRLAREFSKNNEVMVLAPSYHREYDDNALPFRVVRTKSIGISRNDFWALPQITPKVKKALDEFQPDVLHSHTIGMMAGYACSYGKSHNIPVINTVHTKFKYCYEYSLKSKFLVDQMIKHVAKRPNNSDRVTSVSRAMIPELKSYGITKNVDIVRNGNDPIKNKPEIVKKENERFTILYVGLVIKYKNIEFSLKALSELKNRGRDFVFKVVGRGPDTEYFKKKSEELGLKDDVIFNGAITDRQKLCEMFMSSDLFLFTSEFDSDGLVVLESADMETPSLVMDNMGTAERLTDGETGFVVKPEINAIADKIEYLMDNREMLIEVGKNAREIFISWESVAKDYMKIYLEEMEKKKNR